MNDITIQGFHGTNKRVADDILKNEFTYKTNDKHWLGQGIYFYSNFDLAKWWIEKKMIKLSMIGDPAVVSADIKANPHEIINLDNPSDMDLFVDFTLDFIEEMQKSGYEMKLEKDKKSSNQNRCFMLDMMKKHKSIVVVIQTFPKDNPSYGKYNLTKIQDKYFHFGLSYKETQICVSNNDYIFNKKIIYP